MTSQEKQKVDVQVLSNRMELIARATFGAKYSFIIIILLASTQPVNANELYCDPNYIDLDLSEEGRIKAHEQCVREQAAKLGLAANGKKDILKRVGSFVAKHPDFVIGTVVSTVVIATAAVAYPQVSQKVSKMCNHLAVSEITDKEIFERSMDGVLEAY